MAEIAVTTVINRLLPLLTEEARVLGGVHEQVEGIKTELLFIQAYLKDADAKADRGDISHGLQTWIQESREIAYSIEDLIDEYLLHLANSHDKHGFTGFLYKVSRSVQKLKPRHEIASKIRDVQKKVVQLKETSSSYGLVASFEPGSSSSTATTPWHDPRVTSLFIDEAEIVGIEPPKNELINLLVKGNPKRTVISVVGMGGLGKTTLAKRVYDNNKVLGHFDCHAWITVSQAFKTKELLQNTIEKFYQARKEAVPEVVDRMDEMSLITLTRQYLRDKRYVVVFDDVWKPDFWGFIKHVLPENEIGSRIIITRRNYEVASSCKESSFDYIHKLQPLSHEGSWELFCKKTFRGGCPSELQKLSLDIVKSCGGLPLAIVAIGGVLWKKEKTVLEWEKFIGNLSSEFKNNSALESINSILSLSYHDLPYYLKSCFLYLAIFPEDHTIKCAKLFRLWIAEGFVEAKKDETHEELAEKYLSELIQRSLVQVSEVDFEEKAKTCHIHDLVREIILKKAEELRFSYVLGRESSSFDEKFRRISIHNTSNNVSDGTSRKAHIRSIFLFNSEIFLSGGLASKLKLLKVLDFEGAPLDSVPEELGNLLLLTYLSLKNTKVKMLPRWIGKLQNLQTLDIKKTLVRELPAEINRLRKLQNILAYDYSLDFESGWVSVRGIHVKEGIGCLEDLRKLCCVETNEGAGIIEELGKLRQLRRLAISELSRENGQPLCASISNMNHLKSLVICSSSENEFLDLQYISYPPPYLSILLLCGRLEKFPDWISQLRNLGRLSLYGSKLTYLPMQVLEALSTLKELILAQISAVELYFVARGFQKLKKLELYYFMEVKRVRIENGALPLLEHLVIGPCPRLEELPLGVRYLQRLTTLEYTDLQEELKLSMLPNRGRNHEMVEHIPDVHFLDKLSSGGYDIKSLRDLAS